MVTIREKIVILAQSVNNAGVTCGGREVRTPQVGTCDNTSPNQYASKVQARTCTTRHESPTKAGSFYAIVYVYCDTCFDL